MMTDLKDAFKKYQNQSSIKYGKLFLNEVVFLLVYAIAGAVYISRFLAFNTNGYGWYLPRSIHSIPRLLIPNPSSQLVSIVSF